MKVSDSEWHKQLSSLVGTYFRVADELASCAGLGASVFILDIPPSREELLHTGIAIRRAQTIARSSHAHASR
jgi:alkanesulfonate monooxygenase